MRKPQQNRDSAPQRSGPARLARFLVGLALLGLLAAFFASGYAPPGAAGEVLRHNRLHDIDASPLIYSEVEHMTELEAGVRRLREEARQRHDSSEEDRHP
jgi:anti-sigma factor RsiW